MVLYLIGLGLGDVKDITVKGLEAVRRADRVYLEAYTSVLVAGTSKEQLEEFYDHEIILADREMVEQNSDVILADARSADIAFLVVGDPFGATTHTDLVLRAVEQDIPYKVIHNTSIMNAVASCGLQLYNFGETVSIVMWSDKWQPDSYYDKIHSNISKGLHTLCLLDIKVKEQSIENLMKGRVVYDPPRYMSAHEAAHQLLCIVKRRCSVRVNEGETSSEVTETTGDAPPYTPQSLCVGLARLGSDSERIIVSTMAEMAAPHDCNSETHDCNSDSHDFAAVRHYCNLGAPLHSLVIPASSNLHPLEVNMLSRFVPRESDVTNKLLQSFLHS